MSWKITILNRSLYHIVTTHSKGAFLKQSWFRWYTVVAKTFSHHDKNMAITTPLFISLFQKCCPLNYLDIFYISCIRTTSEGLRSQCNKPCIYKQSLSWGRRLREWTYCSLVAKHTMTTHADRLVLVTTTAHQARFHCMCNNIFF